MWQAIVANEISVDLAKTFINLILPTYIHSITYIQNKMRALFMGVEFFCRAPTKIVSRLTQIFTPMEESLQYE